MSKASDLQAASQLCPLFETPTATAHVSTMGECVIAGSVLSPAAAILLARWLIDMFYDGGIEKFYSDMKG